MGAKCVALCGRGVHGMAPGSSEADHTSSLFTPTLPDSIGSDSTWLPRLFLSFDMASAVAGELDRVITPHRGDIH